MAKTHGGMRQTHSEFGARFRGFGHEEMPEGVIEAPNLLSGIVTALPRDKTPITGGESIKNGRIRDDWCGRRGGLQEIVTKPDSDPVIHLVLFHLVTSPETVIVRVTQNSVHVAYDDSGWVAFTGFTFDEDMQLEHAQILDRLYMVTLSFKLIKVDFQAQTYSQVEGAPTARHVVAFAERLVVGNVRKKIGADRPTRIMWSGRLQPEEWDPIENPSAGEVDLSASPSDAGDEIAGLFAIGSELIILRERSIWRGSRLPFAENPFRFEQAVGDIGCDLPHTATKVSDEPIPTQFQSQRGGNQIIFADQRTRSVWAYRPGLRPQRISRQIQDQLYEDLQSLIWAEGAYDPYNQEYHLGLALDSNNPTRISKVWVYSLQHGAWTFDEGHLYSSLAQAIRISDTTFIDELSGDIDSLSGDIDELSPVRLDKPDAVRGTPTGEVLQHDRTAITDWDGTAFEFIFQTVNLGSTQARRQIQRYMIWLETALGGTITGEQSKDNSTWRNSISKTLSGSGQMQKVGIRNQNITGDNLWLRWRTTDADAKFFSWWAKAIEKGLHRND